MNELDESSAPILSVRGLTVSFRTDLGSIRAIDDVSFDVPRGGAVCVVGESGSGKSVTALAMLGLLPPGIGTIERGEVRLDGVDLTKMSERDLRKVRGRKVAMVFQEPMTSLNPVYTVGAQIVEAVRLHRDVSRKEARHRALEVLKLVGMPDPERRIDAYPHELSGGMRQRVMIAMALSCEPDVLLADEPTTALDVTIQAQILDLLRRLRDELSMSVVLITHDLGVVAQFAESVVVMYAGRVVESSSVKELFANPAHPYTAGLLKSIPPMGMARLRDGGRPARLPTIEGVVPSLANLPPGCRFEPRCVARRERCAIDEPELRDLGGRRSRCHYAEELMTSRAASAAANPAPPPGARPSATTNEPSTSIGTNDGPEVASPAMVGRAAEGSRAIEVSQATEVGELGKVGHVGHVGQVGQGGGAGEVRTVDEAGSPPDPDGSHEVSA